MAEADSKTTQIIPREAPNYGHHMGQFTQGFMPLLIVGLVMVVGVGLILKKRRLRSE